MIEGEIFMNKTNVVKKTVGREKEGRRGNKEIRYRQIKMSGSAYMMWLCFITQNIRISLSDNNHR